MITRIDLRHFKCFELLRLPLGQMTLLSGSNASGKSSVLQALVLLHQTMKDHEWSARLHLNGSELSLGTVSDVVDKVSGRRDFVIGIEDEEQLVEWTFEVDSRAAMSAQVARFKTGAEEIVDPTSLQFLWPVESTLDGSDLVGRLRRLCYLTAERVGPRELYSLQDPTSTMLVGPRGESAVSVLHWGRDEHVADGLLLPNTPPTLLRQVEGRMDQFFPGCSIDVQQVPHTNGVTLGLRTSDATNFHRPVNVGFGLTQILPIVVAALSTQPRDLLLVENPEVHLHPAGQALMGEFLATVAAAGVQVLIETHSDHVLNGIRRSVKSDVLDAECVSIHFFQNRDLEGEQVVSPLIDHEGNLDRWPTGFFDQFDKDMNHFAGWED